MVNVYPLDDSREHTLDTTCDCDPVLDLTLPEILVIHNAFAGGNDDPERKWVMLPESTLTRQL